MEKIYIEENQKQKMSAKLTASVGLSFVVAFVAIVSILFISMGGTTYSLDPDDLPDTITTNDAQTALIPTASNAEDFETNPYSTTIGGATKTIYCVESAIGYESTTLNKGGSISDEGFIYLLTSIANLNVGSVTPSGSVSAEDAQKYIKSWLGQTAIWMYLGAINAPNSKDVYGGEGEPNTKDVYVPGNKSILYGVNSIKVTQRMSEIGTITTSSGSFYSNSGLNAILDRAISAHGSSTVLSLDVSVDNPTSFVLKNDYLKSDKIKVKLGSSGLISDVVDDYKIQLDNAPEGTKVYGVTTSGTEEQITNLNKVSYNKYQNLYVYVPANKVKQKVEFSLEVFGSFNVYTGSYYTATGAQKVTTIDLTTKTKNDGVDFSITPAPDTGTDASSIIYIIGMVVLLSGLGILYVNIKNQKQYQQ